MGNFARSGSFQNRDRFLEGFRAMIVKLKNGALSGAAETWEKAGDSDVARLAGFGAKIEFTITDRSWSCAAEIPDWIPIPQRMIEEKFDEKFAELSKL
jgi:hypothetical protein